MSEAGSLSASDLTRSVALQLPDDSLTSMVSACNGQALVVADHTGGVWLFGDANGIDAKVTAQFLWKGPANLSVRWSMGITSSYLLAEARRTLTSSI
jgi:hypothetical protein